MKRILLESHFAWLTIVALSLLSSLATAQEAPPNVLVILVDDLGFSDVGCYGSEIQTPNLDRLAEEGLKFTNFYNTGRCWPTRAALITGYYAQQVGFDQIPGEPIVRRGPRPDWAPMLPERLKPIGYRCYHSGKWHLDGQALKNGKFDRSYLLKDQSRFFNPTIHWKDDVKLPAVEQGTGFYGTTAIADHAIEVLQEHQLNHSDQPFFHFLAFTAPHFPLHALPEDIAEYDGKYDVGWDVVRNNRWKKVQAMGVGHGKLSELESEIGPPYDFPDAIKQLGPGEVNRSLPWGTLNAEQKRFQADKMELHAAMIHRIDIEIGRVLEQLVIMQQLDSTLIMFMSDNGASAEIMVRADGHDPQATPGSAASYLCLGPGWSSVCNTPYRRHKTWTHEGGIHTPLIVHWPNGIKDRGAIRSTVGHVVDVVPTVLDLISKRQELPLQDTADTPKLAGQSLLPAIQAAKNVERESIWWCHENNRAIRVKDWKLVAAAGDAWELFDLKSDPAEQENLIAVHPEIASKLRNQWNEQTDTYRRQIQSYRQNLPKKKRDKK
ncbi:MAG: arylsulfatase A-like enzyme [Mariniblastus sp.]|jgi:arylsulfatase A-like enzyme